MLNLLSDLFFDEYGGLGIVRASLTSAIAEATGDESTDAANKINRLINQRGPSFCNLGPFPFLKSDINFSIGTTDYKYSGSEYLPATYKKVLGAYLLDGTTRCPLTEVSSKEAHNEWKNPDDNTGRPDEFYISRIESDYYEIQFNRKPDGTYTVYMEIELQWVDLTGSTSETLITKEHFDSFTHWVVMARLQQQGDLESYAIAKLEWWDPQNPKSSMLYNLLSSLSSPLKKKRVVVNMEQAGNIISPRMPDYNKWEQYA